MESHGQYCPIAKGAEVIGDRWTLLIVREMLFGVDRFNELERCLPGISRSVLAQRLKHLERVGIIERKSASSGRTVAYALTSADEPTGSLDSASARALIELFERIRRERGVTIVMVTHDPAPPRRPTASSRCSTAGSSTRPKPVTPPIDPGLRRLLGRGVARQVAGRALLDAGRTGTVVIPARRSDRPRCRGRIRPPRSTPRPGLRVAARQPS